MRIPWLSLLVGQLASCRSNFRLATTVLLLILVVQYSLPKTVVAGESAPVFGLERFEARYRQDSRGFAKEPGKTPFRQWNTLLNKMVKEELFEHGRRGMLDALAKEMPLPATATEFKLNLRNSLIDHFISHGDEAGLIEILSFSCPLQWRSQMPLEFELALSTDTIASGLLVLCDAFDKSSDKTNAEIIVKLLRRASFVPVQQCVSDKQFVDRCREWLKSNGGNMEVNLDYGVPGYENAPLFVPKS